MTWKTVMMTGQRNLPVGSESWVRDALADVARYVRDIRGATTGISGMALGADTLWAEAVLNEHLALHAMIPFPDQAARWSVDDQIHRCRLLARTDRVTHVSTTDPTARHGAAARMYHARNMAMLRASDAAIAVLDDRTTVGGTVITTKAANRHGTPGIWLNPRTRTISDTLPCI